MSRAAPKGRKHTYQDYVAAMAGLADAVKRGALPPVLFIHGASDFLIAKTVKVVREHWQGRGDLQTLDAVELDESKLAALMGQSSLFDPASLFVIRRLEQAKSAGKWLKSARPAQGGGVNHLCFVQEGGTLPAGVKAELTRLEAYELPCVEPWPNELTPLIGAMARRAGLPLQQDAVQLLLEAVGADLTKLENEITRLALIFAAPPAAEPQAIPPFAAAALAPMLGMLREDFVFELDNLLLQRQYAKAQALLTGLLQRGESALALLGILARHCRLAIRVHEAQRRAGRPLNPRDVAADLRLPFGVARSYTQYVAKAKPRTFAAALTLCQETDQQLKSSGIAEELLLGRAIEALAAP
jgi:DNA polymerase III delta subunit